MSAVTNHKNGQSRTEDTSLTPEESRARRVEAEKIVFKVLAESGEIFGTYEELRAQLHLYEMSNRLFKAVCKSLGSTKNSFGTVPLINLSPVGDHDRGWRTNESRSYRLLVIER